MKHNLPIQIELPEHFLDEEIRCGYTVTSDMKRLWAVEIDILFQITKICDKHQIKWNANGGTLLGAVRHHGFIPWDDDIDIDMSREDYDKFVYYAQKELKDPYFLQTNETDPKSMYGHAKVRNSLTTGMQISEVERKFEYNQGIFVDIFPRDNIYDDVDIAEQYVKKTISEFVQARYRLYDLKYINFYPLRKNIVKLLYCNLKLYYDKFWLFVKGSSYYQSKYDCYENRMKALNRITTNHVHLYPLGWKRNYYWEKQLFEGDLIYLPFEWFSIPVIPRYKDLLDVVFGEWNTFVKGTSVHGSLFFDTEKPYTDYIK